MSFMCYYFSVEKIARRKVSFLRRAVEKISGLSSLSAGHYNNDPDGCLS